jgi:hypothetical protein
VNVWLWLTKSTRFVIALNVVHDGDKEVYSHEKCAWWVFSFWLSWIFIYSSQCIVAQETAHVDVSAQNSVKLPRGSATTAGKPISEKISSPLIYYPDKAIPHLRIGPPRGVKKHGKYLAVEISHLILTIWKQLQFLVMSRMCRARTVDLQQPLSTKLSQRLLHLLCLVRPSISICIGCQAKGYPLEHDNELSTATEKHGMVSHLSRYSPPLNSNRGRATCCEGNTRAPWYVRLYLSAWDFKLN